MQKTPYSSRKASEKTLLEDYAGQIVGDVYKQFAEVALRTDDDKFDAAVAEVSFTMAEAMVKEAEKRR